MVMHAIVLEKENAQVAARIAAHYPKHYQVNATCFLVRTEDLSSKVAATPASTAPTSPPTPPARC